MGEVSPPLKKRKPKKISRPALNGEGISYEKKKKNKKADSIPPTKKEKKSKGQESRKVLWHAEHRYLKGG